MLKLIVSIQILLVIVSCRNSPNGYAFLAYLSDDVRNSIPQDIIEDMLSDVPGIITKYKYPLENYHVTTDDGYILEIFRIPKENATPVLFMHGLLGSAADWIMNKPDISLPYILSDAGYDVWLGNARGNYYSRRHESFDPNDSPFWKFDWHEIGYYDAPAMIDFILKKNGRDRLHYIGHSQGSTAFFVMASTRVDYNYKIISMNALGPSAYLINSKLFVLKTFAHDINILQKMYLFVSTGELAPSFEFRRKIATMYCNENAPKLNSCMTLTFGGYHNFNYMNLSRIPIYLSHAPAGSSIQQLSHYSQVYNTKEFKQFDHGAAENMILYKTRIPPAYMLSNITSPVALHYSENDDIIDVSAVDKLHSELGNPVGKFLVTRKSFTHGDFVLAVDCKELVYVNVINVMKTQEKSNE